MDPNLEKPMIMPTAPIAPTSMPMQMPGGQAVIVQREFIDKYL